MRTINILTTNNVVIEYQLGTTQQRILAFVLDALILLVWLLICAMAAQSFGDRESVQSAIALFMVPAYFYTLTFETFNGGQTPGKRALGLKVMRMDGQPATFNDCFTRWVMRLLDIWLSMGAVAVLLISSSSREQRVGGFLSQTIVIQSNPKTLLNVKDLLNIQAAGSAVKFEGVSQYTDDDMLIVKQTIDRSERYNNASHKEAVNELAERIRKQLGIKETKMSDLEFLRKVLQDYIVITRS